MRKTLNFPSGPTVAVIGVAVLVLAGCGTGEKAASGPGAASGGTTGVAADTTAVVSANVRKGARDVPVSTLVSVHAEHATLSSVKLSSAKGAVAGALAKDGRSWTAGDRLEPATSYTLTSMGTDEAGQTVTRTARFTTQALTLQQQTYPSIAPLQGETVGVGMPVIVTFDVPVTDRKSIEKNLHVSSTPAQPGSWHWISSNEVRWRPKSYWKPGTHVQVSADVNGVDAGNGIYGQLDKDISFDVGAAHIYKVNTRTDQMRVYSNGKLLRTIPITTGQQPAYTTRSGTKVIIEKFASKDMNSETVGITGADAYNIKGVKWAMRLTYSGEFIHAAPWSVGYQGHANVSHGCTGMSTENAGWLFAMSRRGDVVEYTGTSRAMEPTNGYGDWNIPFQQYKADSAL
ncbi:Ig-like domain-containing protein [Nocardioides maradonensis]